MADNDGMPVLGDSVHYFTNGECHAAIVTGVVDTAAGEEGPLDLIVFRRGRVGLPLVSVPRDETWDEAEGFTEGSWHWNGRG